MREQVTLKLRRIAEDCSRKANENLHYTMDNLEYYLETNEEIDEYLSLLDTLTHLNYWGKMKAGDLVQYNSRLLLVLGPNADDYGYAAGWWRCQEVGTNRIRIYSPTQLTVIKTEAQFYL